MEKRRRGGGGGEYSSPGMEEEEGGGERRSNDGYELTTLGLGRKKVSLFPLRDKVIIARGRRRKICFLTFFFVNRIWPFYMCGALRTSACGDNCDSRVTAQEKKGNGRSKFAFSHATQRQKKQFLLLFLSILAK